MVEFCDMEYVVAGGRRFDRSAETEEKLSKIDQLKGKHGDSSFGEGSFWVLKRIRSRASSELVGTGLGRLYCRVTGFC